MGKHGIKIGHLNVNGLLSKFSQIELLLVECKFDVFAITETHLNSKIRDEEILIAGYSMENKIFKNKIFKIRLFTAWRGKIEKEKVEVVA